MAEYQEPVRNGRNWIPYEELLDVNGVGIMGYIDIDAIGVELPIYHGTDAGRAERGRGPSGGQQPARRRRGQRTACSPRTAGCPAPGCSPTWIGCKRATPSPLTVLDRLLTYEIDQILIVEPEEVDALAIDSRRRIYRTLVTCTPYGINTHRLLVQGQPGGKRRPKA